MKFAQPIIGAVVVGLALCGSKPAFAKALSLKEINKIRSITVQFGDCVMKHNAALGRAVVLSNLSNDVILHSASRLIDGNCLNRTDAGMGSQMTFTGDQFRYAMAGALVRMDYPVRRHFDFTNVLPLVHAIPKPVDPSLKKGSRKAAKAEEEYAKDRAFLFLSRFGECVARRNPDRTQDLLLADIGTVEEKAAFNELSASLGECLGDGQMSFGREMLRGSLALNFYRLAGAPLDARVVTLKVDN
ncbi:hypothetical protein Sj15T_04840 [Sphingobium sp. TA15]|uniref:Uncharacterized protein n=1 Tax=Sphingobium indicum (strain DSM 16413 / CCM 7287 / MTCC 6362 / UT26 / NBRC 101211 / UT26S) TaxID=452662 RepID=D4Z0N0_SPHIU|nr:hypothetical protein [Sphingobium indicum]BAI96162.1 hypothetical protein SJA_C1-13280 [Sphingobium indicum UT26S]BDD65463.1 hypothetical protein Sj15T_04840 [Sphingobium sp. TA15]